MKKLYSLVNREGVAVADLARYAFPKRLTAITDKQALQALVCRMERVGTLEAFEGTLAALEAQLDAPSEAWQAAFNEGVTALKPAELEKVLSPEVKSSLLRWTLALSPTIQTSLIEGLCRTGAAKANEVATQLCLFFDDYLHLLHKTPLLTAAYLEAWPTLIQTKDIAWVLPHLNTLSLPALSYEFFAVMSGIPYRYGPPALEEGLRLFEALMQTIAPDPEPRLRVLTKMER